MTALNSHQVTPEVYDECMIMLTALASAAHDEQPDADLRRATVDILLNSEYPLSAHVLTLTQLAHEMLVMLAALHYEVTPTDLLPVLNRQLRHEWFVDLADEDLL